MVLRLFIIFCCFVVIIACNNKPQQTEDTSNKTNTTDVLTETDIAKLKYIEFALDPKVEVLTEPWQPYSRLKTAITNIKTANFSFFDEDEQAIFQLVKELRKDIPDTLKTQSVLSRITIVENMLYKLDETYKLNTTTKSELAASTKELLVAYSNLNFQLNKKLEKDNQKIVRP
ncbi:hypothetical protein SAMN05421824_0121 [Hyunsoonleella jejuensis]|uniref:Uncharacterized protein n=1 Tax=Hyunsoonleella jejuensis TaxID=419940 RepID=A0A1H9A358_9FLAO|nr:hypothetical protein [Hyunsoonleella jejuensis]SEP71094.1 hypothetical protein SAMN05421824_0121 [Hyunsoonleella jejuensis]